MDLVTFITSTSVATALVLTPIVMAVVSGFKGLGMDSKWAFLLSLGLGIVGGLAFGGATIALDILLGVIIGLSASGLYSGVKSTATAFITGN